MSVKHGFKALLPWRQGKALRHREDGQGLIEAVIILPILLIILAAVADLGIMFFAAQTVQHATREGARFAAKLTDLEADDPRVISYVETYIPSINLYSGFVHGASNTGITNCATSDEVTVTVSGVYDFLTLNMIGINSTPLSFSTTMRYEHCDD